MAVLGKTLAVCLGLSISTFCYSQEGIMGKGFLKEFKMPPKNYVNNGNFTEGLKGWHYFDMRGGAIVPEGIGGENCFKISGSFRDYIYLINLGTGGWAINLKEGHTYTISALFKSENLKRVDVNNILVISNYGWTNAVGVGPGQATTAGWVRRTLTFTPPPQTRKHDETGADYCLRLFWPVGAGGTLWVTDIQVEEGSSATKYSNLWNFKVMEIAEKLKKLHEGLVLTKNTLAEKYSAFPLANELKERIKSYACQIEKIGDDTLTHDNLNTNSLSAIEKEIASVSDGMAKVVCPVWFKNPYLMAMESDFPKSLQVPGSQKLTCYLNEVRNVGLMVTNLTGKNIDARIAPQIFNNVQIQQKIAGCQFITVYNAPFIRGYRDAGKRFAEPLAKANIMNHFIIPAGETRQAVISFSTRDIYPGTYYGAILFDPLDNKACAQKIEFEIDVLPTRLPDSVPVDVGAFGSHTLRPEEVQALGHNVQMLDMSSVFPNADKNGILHPIDFTHLDCEIKEARQVVPNCKFMMIFSVGMRFIAVAEKNIQWSDERLKCAWKAWVRELCEHMEAVGVDKRSFLLEVADEPGPAQAITALELQRLAKEAAPGLLTAATLTGYHPETKSYESYYEDLDYVIPNVSAIKDGKCAAYFKTKGKQVAVYDCQETMETINPITYCRLMPWRVWRQGLSGWYYWYLDEREPNWSSAKKMSTVYPVRMGNGDHFSSPLWPEDEYVITRRWLGMEAGYQDYKALFLLMKVLQHASKQTDVGLIKKAEAFLREAPVKALGLDAPEKYPRDMSKGADPDMLDTMREEMATLTTMLLRSDRTEIIGEPVLSPQGELAFESNTAVTAQISYLLDGKLPWKKVTVTMSAKNHSILLPKENDQNVTKCLIMCADDLGKVSLISPFIMPKVSVDSVFKGSAYDVECLIDGERLPAAQYWPGKTWISEPTDKEHWVTLEWPEPRKVNKMTICWMTFGGLPTAYKIQYLEDNGANKSWTDITTEWRCPEKAYDEINFAPKETRAVRVVQRAGGGNPLNPNMMGLSEIEVLSPKMEYNWSLW